MKKSELIAVGVFALVVAGILVYAFAFGNAYVVHEIYMGN